MRKDYDEVIEQHYQGVAQKQGLSSTSTMADERTRELETDAIVKFVGLALESQMVKNTSANIMDVGCGNGYTLEVLAKKYKDHNFVGIEKSDNLRELASSRFKNSTNVNIFVGDVRDPDFSKHIKPDILICQRVLINLLDENDQKLALENIVNAVISPGEDHVGGALLFIEAFSTSLGTLNEARAEFGFEPIPPAHHNLYLPDDFFDNPQLVPFAIDLLPSNFLSTHYYVTRVLHPLFSEGKAFKRNSEFVKFFSGALQQNVGDYAPLKMNAFKKVNNDRA
jgi:SAM-dependent methyltransferase